jgi:hypothetical protein
VFLIQGWKRNTSPSQQEKGKEKQRETKDKVQPLSLSNNNVIHGNGPEDTYSPVQCVVKLFSPFFGGTDAYETELDFYRLLPHNPKLNGLVPRLLAKGSLDPDACDKEDNDIPGLIPVRKTLYYSLFFFFCDCVLNLLTFTNMCIL